MATATTQAKPSATWSDARLRRHLGMIPAERIMRSPKPGSATVDDVVTLDDHHHMICELVDGVLVRKPMGTEESMLAMFLGRQIGNFADKDDLGIVLGEAGFLELTEGLVRGPDVSFIAWDQLPDGKLPKKRIARLFPNLAVEVLSESNTAKEMARKRQEYFAQGTQIVWQVNPADKTVEVFTSPTESTMLRVGQTLDGGPVLPGFKLKLSKIFTAGRKGK